MTEYLFIPDAREQKVIVDVVDHIIQGDLDIPCLCDRPDHVLLEDKLLIEVRSWLVLLVYPRRIEMMAGVVMIEIVIVPHVHTEIMRWIKHQAMGQFLENVFIRIYLEMVDKQSCHQDGVYHRGEFLKLLIFLPQQECKLMPFLTAPQCGEREFSLLKTDECPVLHEMIEILSDFDIGVDVNASMLMKGPGLDIITHKSKFALPVCFPHIGTMVLKLEIFLIPTDDLVVWQIFPPGLHTFLHKLRLGFPAKPVIVNDFRYQYFFGFRFR